jgi:nitroimidazol reductase NimA-like FMN-containing flavoprotein (pyridoxamine 5'-phosphate oxidase superfamily)
MPDTEAVQQDLAGMARAIIDANRYMTLATADGEGRPWASPVFYATADYTEFYWISAPEAVHSRNLARRPQVSIVIFDSGVPEGTGQAVYMPATAERVLARDLDRGLAVYPGQAEHGGVTFTQADVQAPAPYRLYRATVSAHSVLCPRDAGPCALHGLPFDHRTQVRAVGRSR